MEFEYPNVFELLPQDQLVHAESVSKFLSVVTPYEYEDITRYERNHRSGMDIAFYPAREKDKMRTCQTFKKEKDKSPFYYQRYYSEIELCENRVINGVNFLYAILVKPKTNDENYTFKYVYTSALIGPNFLRAQGAAIGRWLSIDDEVKVYEKIINSFRLNEDARKPLLIKPKLATPITEKSKGIIFEERKNNTVYLYDPGNGTKNALVEFDARAQFPVYLWKDKIIFKEIYTTHYGSPPEVINSTRFFDYFLRNRGVKTVSLTDGEEKIIPMELGEIDFASSTIFVPLPNGKIVYDPPATEPYQFDIGLFDIETGATKMVSKDLLQQNIYLQMSAFERYDASTDIIYFLSGDRETSVARYSLNLKTNEIKKEGDSGMSGDCVYRDQPAEGEKLKQCEREFKAFKDFVIQGKEILSCHEYTIIEDTMFDETAGFSVSSATKQKKRVTSNGKYLGCI